MDWIDRLERKFGAFAIPHLTLILVIGQAMTYLASGSGQVDISTIALIPPLVMEGQVYRLFSFIFFPPGGPTLLVIIGLYIFWMMGSALENQWGAFRYNLFLLIGYLCTVAAALLVLVLPFCSPIIIVDNYLIGGTVFLAFAWLFPDFEFLAFFVLPIKSKWLALITWIGYGLAFIAGETLSSRAELAAIAGYGNSVRLLILAGLANFFIFFGKDIIAHIHAWKRRREYKKSWEEPSFDHDEDDD